ncbi:Os08g0236866 [Oryza sativa Japonica Group]|uniref:Uncharacterized protein n=2 Tax=Oryza sativa subsp. japonica TaxID=39947 RepID=A0A8J8XK17_ORYSJ|nr:hypothetical protein OsJ_26527 [Oryza sativa Japonica Group]BAT04468.1 Os08g0236866 [Oryza sativa Japonica Group]
MRTGPHTSSIPSRPPSRAPLPDVQWRAAGSRSGGRSLGDGSGKLQLRPDRRRPRRRFPMGPGRFDSTPSPPQGHPPRPNTAKRSQMWASAGRVSPSGYNNGCKKKKKRSSEKIPSNTATACEVHREFSKLHLRRSFKARDMMNFSRCKSMTVKIWLEHPIFSADCLKM